MSTEKGPGSESPDFTRFLAELKKRGLAVGIREHLLVERLLARWDDPGSVRDALAALLARNQDEVRIVRETFDEWFTPPPLPPVLSLPLVGRSAGKRRRAKLLGAGIGTLLVVSLLLSLMIVPPTGTQKIESPWSSVLEVLTGPVQPPEPEVYTTTAWPLVIGTALVLALSFLLWTYRSRLAAVAVRFARRSWAGQLDRLPGPQSYDLKLRGLAPPFPRNLLDDLAKILGRAAAAPHARELDVDRSLARTLAAGLAPHFVMRSRRPAAHLLVLEDIAQEMSPWQERIEALLRGLTARGVLLDRWKFNGNAGRLFRSWAGPFVSLAELARMSKDKPLLILSAGQGILEGNDFRLAPWVDVLECWPHRVWLHPADDPRSWRAALRRVPVPVFAMDRAGLLSATRRLTSPEAVTPEEAPKPEVFRHAPERPVTPLDVDRLRWLLSLSPRRDPVLGELLRQRFCPHVPPAALAEALDAPPLPSSPGIGPSEAEVRSFLLRVLEDSRPQEGTAGYERWRLDRALQALHVDEAHARKELAALAEGPLGLEVERAVKRLDRGSWRRVRGEVLKPLRSRAKREGFLKAKVEGGRRSWVFPTPGELGAALLCAAGVLAISPQLPLFQVQEEQIDTSSLESPATSNTTEADLLGTDLMDREPMGTDPMDPMPPQRAGVTISLVGTEVIGEVKPGDRARKLQSSIEQVTVEKKGGEKSECGSSKRTISRASAYAEARLLGQKGTRIELSLTTRASSAGGHYVKCVSCVVGQCIGLLPHDTTTSAQATARATATIGFFPRFRDAGRYRLRAVAYGNLTQGELTLTLPAEGVRVVLSDENSIDIQGEPREIQVIVELKVQSRERGAAKRNRTASATVTLSLEPLEGPEPAR